MKSFSIPSALLLLTLAACRSRARIDDFCAADANVLASCIELIAIQTGSIPTSSQGLEILVEKQIVTKLPADSWGRQFRYVPDCVVRPQKFVILSLGEDGIPSSDDRVFSFTVEHGENGVPGQPATRPELKSEGSDKPQPEVEGRSR